MVYWLFLVQKVAFPFKNKNSILIKNEISKNILMTWENLMLYKVKIVKKMLISKGFQIL